MQVYPTGRLKTAVTLNRTNLQDGFVLLAVMTFAVLIAYEYDIFQQTLGASPQERTISLDEVLALTTLFCIGLLVLSFRLLLSQREVARRIGAEHRARE